MLDRPLPDLAADLALRRVGQTMRLRLERAGEELATGRRSDLFAASGRDPARLMAIERGQAAAAAKIEGLALAESRVTSVQAALERIRESAEGIGAPLLAAVRRGDPLATRALAGEAGAAFSDVVARLNTRSGGRAIFAGSTVDREALASADTMLADLAALAAGASDSADLVARMDAWFDDAGGPFETTAWRGEGPAPRIRLGEGATTPLSFRADAPEFREVLKALALAAVVADPAYAGPADAVDPVLEIAAARSIAAVDSVIELQSEIGISQARLEEASVAASAARAALDVAWNDAVARDPYEAASEFQSLEVMVQTAYTVTARISRLSLADFLR